METKNIMIVGVGGQGSLLASKLLGWLLLNEGYDVKVSEVHGMSQRGGSVVTYVRFGEKVYSPIIDKGEADLIVSFEKLEAVRYLDYLKPDGTVVVNIQQIDPMPVVTLAREAGSEKAVNLVLLGRLSRHYDIPLEHWQAAIEVCVPKKFLEINQKAFLLGRNTKLDGEN